MHVLYFCAVIYHPALSHFLWQVVVTTANQFYYRLSAAVPSPYVVYPQSTGLLNNFRHSYPRFRRPHTVQAMCGTRLSRSVFWHRWLDESGSHFKCLSTLPLFLAILQPRDRSSSRGQFSDINSYFHPLLGSRRNGILRTSRAFVISHFYFVYQPAILKNTFVPLGIF